MPKYQLQSLFPKGTSMPEEPTKEKVRECLAKVKTYGHSEDPTYGAYVICNQKLMDFEEYGAYWVELPE